MPIITIFAHIVLYIPYVSKFSIFLKFRGGFTTPPWIRHCGQQLEFYRTGHWKFKMRCLPSLWVWIGWTAFLASGTSQEWRSSGKRLKNDLEFHQTGHWKFKMGCSLLFEYELGWTAFLAYGTPQKWISRENTGKWLSRSASWPSAYKKRITTQISNLAAPATGSSTFTRQKHDEKHTCSHQIFTVWSHKPPEHSPLGSLFQCCIKKRRKIRDFTFWTALVLQAWKLAGTII